MASVRFGLSLPNRAVLFGVPTETLIQAAEQADQSGLFDGVWVGDNILSKPRLEAVVILSAIAARTQRVKLGTICLASFPMRHALLFALQWASLDVLSGGRTLLTVCNGGAASLGPVFAKELAAMGIRSDERMSRVEEGIEVLRLLWGKDPVTYHGKYYTFDDVELYPKPVQADMPIAIAVNPLDPKFEETAFRRVARLADGWQSDGTPPDLFRARWNRIREYAEEYGRADRMRHSIYHMMVNINDDPAAAKRESVEFLDKYYGVGTVGDDFLQWWLAAGPPEAVIEKIARFVEAGCTTPVLRFTSPDQRGQLERCISEVLPAFRDQITVAAG
jgi:alkanesulfonate monooxygenase SsuD/methylene tetrahydromethanopterin reductase-like flavin-dependent oxidoreductase (luciferase family)